MGTRIAVLLLLLGALACDEEPEGPPRRYVPDGRGSGDPGRRAPADRAGGETEPGEPPPAYWECYPLFYNHDGGCDCGCGIPDPDCDGAGCATPGCNADGCEFCHIHEGIEYTCGGTAPPAGWTCSGYYFSDSDCDCGCSVADPACAKSGCISPGCSHPDCVYCWDGTEPIDCGP